MKRLLFSDIHLNTWAYGAEVMENGMNSRLYRQHMAIRDMVEDAADQGVKYAYFFGDLFHVHGMIQTQALTVAADLFQALEDFEIKIRAIPGNHDMATREGRFHALQFLPTRAILGRWEDDGLLVRALPYTEDQAVLDAFLEESAKEGGMLMLHQGVQGVPLASGYVLDEKLTPEMIPSNCRAFTGHYHFHRAVSPNLTVVGNLVPLTWGDIDQSKGWVIWDDQTGALEQRVQSSSPGFITWNYEQDLNLVSGNFVRYTTPVAVKEMDKIRADLIKEGALMVEFPELKLDKKKDKIRSGEEVTIEKIVGEFESDDMTPRRKQVGKELREERYAAQRS